MHLLSLSLSLSLAALAAMPVSASAVLDKRAISCLKVGATATASWTNAAGQSCRWTGVVGSNFGTNSVNGGDYSCNGRCGGGCSGASLGNAYTQDCFSHDVCSWFYNASGGSSDANCGASYDSAVDDTIGGVLVGCGQTNPSNAAVEPSTSPVCS